ncbi:hypothetical protein FB45DRAFT_1057087 [Roridomyces roridus]|uniref:NACHT domain-containing protein n=1 Tax=Roridomyces roridus TaxID=1738132 RepID=A0AAD7BZZ0_9AGAR|nr:hypothetical protein FB45DRAFT_1057087 [Roridomyces roridus]
MLRFCTLQTGAVERHLWNTQASFDRPLPSCFLDGLNWNLETLTIASLRSSLSSDVYIRSDKLDPCAVTTVQKRQTIFISKRPRNDCAGGTAGRNPRQRVIFSVIVSSLAQYSAHNTPRAVGVNNNLFELRAQDDGYSAALLSLGLKVAFLNKESGWNTLISVESVEWAVFGNARIQAVTFSIIMPSAAPAGSVLAYTSIAVSTLKVIAEGPSIPFLKTIAGISSAILTLAESAKSNKEQCMGVVSRVNAVLSVILDLCIEADGSGNLSPEILWYIGEFADTLQKVHSFIEAQQSGSSFKRIFRQGGGTTQLKACQDGLDRAFSVFGVETSLTTASEVEHFREKAEKRHEQLMQLLHEQESDFALDAASQISKSTFSFGSSATSFDLIPGKPKIFHGREEDLQELVQLLLQRPARVAVLGPGGIGKTSLATSALHHPDVCAKYAQLFFISCESVANREDLIASLASHVGLPPARNPLKAVLRRLAEYASVMLVLDNLETCWEPPDSRGPIEDLLSLLTDVETLGLLASIRSRSRIQVRWTRPCLPPLAPLSNLAAMQTFVDITDDSADDSGTMSEILQITDNLPLAISLVANIAAFEGHDAVLSRWQEQKTTLFSDGSDRRSNLDVSIQLSLSSPRMLQSPGAHQLLSLLSLLPEGISEADLMQCKLPIGDFSMCQTTLIRTSLAYIDHGKRLRVLVPIREYFKQYSPPMPVLCRHLRSHFHRLIVLWKDYQHVSTAGIAQRITANVGNFQAVLTQGLNLDEPDVVETIHGIIMLDSFFRVSGRRTSGLLTQLPPYMDKIDDHLLSSLRPGGTRRTGDWSLESSRDPAGEAKLLLTLSHYYRHTNTDIPRALEYLEEGLRLSQRAQNPAVQCTIMREISQTHWQQGRYPEAQAMAQELRRLAQVHGLLHDEVHAIRCDLLCRVSLGDLAPCIALSAEARSILEFCGFQSGPLYLALINSDASVHLMKTEYAEARALYTRISQKNSPIPRAYDQLNLALIEAEHSSNRLGALLDLRTTDIVLAYTDIRDGFRPEARAALQRVLINNPGNEPDIAVLCLTRLGDITCRLLDERATFGYAVGLLGLSIKGKNKPIIYDALRLLGHIFVAQHDDETALSLFQLALEGLTAMGIHRSRGDCLLGMGDIFHRRRDQKKAMDHWNAARPCFVQVAGNEGCGQG